jgi:hypothetical protein
LDKWLSVLMLGVPKEQQPVVVTVLWRVIMMGWVLWACGAFAVIGLPGFSLATDVERLKESADISARISLAQEIRLYASARCKADDREPFDRVIDRLQLDYERITGGRYPEPRCP